MEKNKKGFTLIELLAVIVILAVIALIATPLIMNTISDAKEGSAKNSASGYVKALEQTISKAMVKDNTFQPDNRQIGVGKVTGVSQKEIVSGNLTKVDVSYDIDYKGTKPTGIDFILKNGDVVKDSKITISGYTFTMDEKGEWIRQGSEIDLPKEPESFETDSWDTIARAVKLGNTELYNVGDRKKVPINGLGTYTVRIANMSTPEDCFRKNFSQSSCGFVVEFEDVITKHVINSTSTNLGGYPKSEMRTYLNGEFFDKLPIELQRNIKTIKVVSSHGTFDTQNFISTEKVYLLSTKEVWGSNPVANDSASDESRQLDYYKNNNVTLNTPSGAIKKHVSNEEKVWWLRSASTNYDGHFFYVYIDGHAITREATDEFWISPAFRIG